MKIIRNISFDDKSFFRSVALWIVLDAAWTFLWVKTNAFIRWHTDLISSLGYLLIFTVAIFFGQKRKSLEVFLSVAGIIIATYLAGTLSWILLLSIAGLFRMNSSSTLLMLLFAASNSLLVSFVLTKFLGIFYSIQFKYTTIIATASAMTLAYCIDNQFSNSLHLYYDIRPSLVTFNIFNLLLLVPLSLGMTIIKVKD